MTMKRKDIDDFSDDFSDFSISSTARKIRRLNGELALIVEEIIDEAAVPSITTEEMIEEKQQLQIQELLPNSISAAVSSTSPIVENIDIDNDNQERAMVLFKPVNPQLLHHYSSPSNYSVSLPPQFISGLKNHFLWSSGTTNSAQEEATNDCMAVVPWVAPQQLPFAQPQIQMESPPPELMDIEDSNSNSMDQHDGTSTAVYYDFGGTRPSNSLPQSQWQEQQQHCMTPHLPHNNPTPISLFN